MSGRWDHEHSPLAADLDRVGVRRWRARMLDARSRDREELVRRDARQIARPSRHYDAAWSSVKADYRRLTGGTGA